MDFNLHEEIRADHNIKWLRKLNTDFTKICDLRVEHFTISSEYSTH
jgi:hypothetical protein